MNRFWVFRSLLALATALAMACGVHHPAPAPVDLEALRVIIAEQNQRFTKAHVDGDVATIDAMFTRDAKSYPPGAEVVSGRAAIHDLTVDYLKAGIKDFREETTDFYGSADLLIDQGNYVVTYGADNVTEHGKYLNVWKREDGAWKIHANIWNTSPGPAAGH